jgi:hypothetical protein
LYILTSLPSSSCSIVGALSPVPIWTRIVHCDGSSSTDRMDYSAATIQDAAVVGTRIAFCTAGEDPSLTGADCLVSNPDSFPIEMLRTGQSVSHNNGLFCDQSCVDTTWSGPRAASNAWNTCTSGLLYHACNNFNGLHLGTGDGSPCGWSSGVDSNIEIFLYSVFFIPCDASTLLENAAGLGDCSSVLKGGESCTNTPNSGSFCTASTCLGGILTEGSCAGKNYIFTKNGWCDGC